MLQWLREALRALPSQYANLLLFCTLTGMRGSECIESIKLLNCHTNANLQNRSLANNSLDGQRYYYNPSRWILQHYLFPQIFIRRTKAIYISIVNDEIIGIAQKVGDNPSMKGVERAMMKRCLSMKIKYCRKIHASWLHHRGISSELIDALQGRISKNIFLRHYLTPDSSFKTRVLDVTTELQKHHYNQLTNYQ